jgi:hypothetical protein
MMWLDWWWIVAVLLVMVVTNYAFFWPPLSLKKRILLLLAVMVLDMGVTVVLCVEAGDPLFFTAIFAPLMVIAIFLICIYNLQNERRGLEALWPHLHIVELEELKTQLISSRVNLPYAPAVIVVVLSVIARASGSVILLLLAIGLVLGHISREYFLRGIYREWGRRSTGHATRNT